MKLTTTLAVLILAFNAVLVGTFAHSAVTQTPDPQPWTTINQVL